MEVPTNMKWKKVMVVCELKGRRKWSEAGLKVLEWIVELKEGCFFVVFCHEQRVVFLDKVEMMKST